MRLASYAALALLAATPCAATTIDFTDKSQGAHSSPFVYPEAIFSSDTGTIFVGASHLASEICAVTANLDCTGNLSVAFTSPVNDLSFESVGDDKAGENVFADVTTTQGSYFYYIGDSDGDSKTFDFQDLSAFSNITGLTIYSSNLSGLAYDYFTFTSAAPEPSVWAMIGVGLGGVGLLLRRAKRKLSRAVTIADAA